MYWIDLARIHIWQNTTCNTKKENRDPMILVTQGSLHNRKSTFNFMCFVLFSLSLVYWRWPELSTSASPLFWEKLVDFRYIFSHIIWINQLKDCFSLLESKVFSKVKDIFIKELCWTTLHFSSCTWYANCLQGFKFKITMIGINGTILQSVS